MGSITDIPSPSVSFNRDNNSQLLHHYCPHDMPVEKCFPSSSIRAFLTFLLVFVIVLSLLGNVLLCAIVYRRSAMRSAINLLLANVALSDFLMSLLHIPFSLAVLSSLRWPFNKSVCELNGFVFLLLNCEKVLVLLVISIDRYFIIVKRCDTLSPKKSKILIVSSWTLSFLISFPPLLGWGLFRYPRGCLQCLVQDENGEVDRLAKSFIIFSTILSIILPGLTLMFIYNRILRTVRRNGFRVQNHPPVTPTAMHKKGKYFIDYCYKTRTSTTILLLSFIFLVAVSPLGIVNFYIAVHGYSSISMKVYIGLLIFSYFHCAANPLLYYWRIKKYRESVNDLCSQIFVFPHCIVFSAHRERRVRPHILYKVDVKNHTHCITDFNINSKY